MVRCTVYLDEQEWRKLRMGCLERKLSASQILRGLIVEHLARWESEEIPEHSPQISTRDSGTGQ